MVSSFEFETQLANADLSNFTLIPLHRPGDKSKKHGRVRKDGKRPLDFNWTTKTYKSSDVLARGLKEQRNIGVRLKSDQLVIDVDPRNGGDDGFTKLCLDLGLDSEAWPCVVTGSGGFHFYMSKPSDLLIVDTLEGYTGVEFKSKGRQVVAPGSVHPDTGKTYRWRSPFKGKMPAAPSTLLDAISRPARSDEASGGGQYTQEQIARALEALDPTEFRDHDTWLRLMMACHHASDGDARHEFIEWSTMDPSYAHDADIIGRRWDSLHGEKAGAITYRTLNKILADHGAASRQVAGDIDDDFEGEPTEDDEGELERGGEVMAVEARGLKVNRNSIAADTFTNALAAVAKSGLSPAWDELRQNVVFRADRLPWDDSFGRLLNDHVLRLLRMFFVQQHQGVDYQPGADHLFNALAGIAYTHKFNPVLEYLESLTWDGTKRVERLFSDYFQCGDDAYTRAISVAFAVGAVRRMRKPGSKFDTMPVLKGAQGVGKSSGLKALFGAEWVNDTDLGNLRDKDAPLKLRGKWLHEFAEIESLTRAETGQLKAFISSATDRQRDPYGKIAEDQPRRCVFAATVNEGGYLKDSTGSRRFWPLDVTGRIDVARIAADRDQLWAEAAALEAQGTSDVLPERLWATAAERQADQTSDDPWGDALADFLERREWEHAMYLPYDDDLSPPPSDRVHTSELFEELQIAPESRTKDKAQRLRTVMESALGWRHRRNVRVGDRIGAGYARV